MLWLDVPSEEIRTTSDHHLENTYLIDTEYSGDTLASGNRKSKLHTMSS